MASRRVLVVLASLLLILLAPRPVRAECQLTAIDPHASLVRVDALEHAVEGVVYSSPDLVVVPYRAVEVDKIGGPDAYVIAVDGSSVPARIVTTDARRRLALLRAARPVGAPLPVEDATRACAFVTTRSWRDLVTVAELEALTAPPAGTAVAVGTAGRRSVIGYGGIALSTFEMAAGGGAWWGGRGSVAGRYRDLLEGRLDLGLSFLLPRHDGGDDCGEPPCFAGARFTLTPSIGLHLRIASVEHRLAGPVALKPSLGAAFVFQEVTDRGRAKAFDANAPGASWTLAPGLAAALHIGEIGVRVRLPRGEVRAPTWEIAVGFLF